MKTAALRVSINGREVAVAGAPDLSLLSGQVGIGVSSSGGLDLSRVVLSVMGLAVAGPSPQQLTWCDGVLLQPGDSVTFEVVETDSPTPPSATRRTPDAAELANAASVEKRTAKKARR